MIKLLRILFLFRILLAWAATACIITIITSLICMALGTVGGLAISGYAHLLGVDFPPLTHTLVVLSVTLFSGAIGFGAGLKLTYSMQDPTGHILAETFDTDHMDMMKLFSLTHPKPAKGTLYRTLKGMTPPCLIIFALASLIAGPVAAGHAYLPNSLALTIFGLFLLPSLPLFVFLPPLQKLRYLLFMGSALTGGALIGWEMGSIPAGMMAAIIAAEAFSSRSLNILLFRPTHFINPKANTNLTTYAIKVARLSHKTDTDISLASYDGPLLAGAAPPFSLWNPGETHHNKPALLYLYSIEPFLEFDDRSLDMDYPTSAHQKLQLEQRLAAYPE